MRFVNIFLASVTLLAAGCASIPYDIQHVSVGDTLPVTSKEVFELQGCEMSVANILTQEPCRDLSPRRPSIPRIQPWQPYEYLCGSLTCENPDRSVTFVCLSFDLFKVERSSCERQWDRR